MNITKVSATARSQRRKNPISDALQVLDTEGSCDVLIEASEGSAGGVLFSS